MRVRGQLLLVCSVLILATFINVFQASYANAGQITTRSLTLQPEGSVGGSTPGGIVNHLFTFTLPNVGAPNVGSIKFEYCTVASNVGASVCIAPKGMDASTIAAGSQTGATGFAVGGTSSANDVDSISTVNSYYLTRTAASIPAGTTVTMVNRLVKNPTTLNTATTSATFYVRISTYTSTNATGSPLDTGVVAASVAQQIQLSGVMPESLIFCTGGTITSNAGVPDCTTATSGVIAFDRLFSPSDTALASSQMAASTNAQFGYSITVQGATLTSGSNTIAPMTAAAVSTKGTGQFGMNLVANTTPVIGANITTASNGTDLKGRALAGYDTADTFKFTANTATPIADSAQGGVGPTNGQTYTVSYIVNVPGNQLPGTYATTLTYICTPTF